MSCSSCKDHKTSKLKIGSGGQHYSGQKRLTTGGIIGVSIPATILVAVLLLYLYVRRETKKRKRTLERGAAPGDVSLQEMGPSPNKESAGADRKNPKPDGGAIEQTKWLKWRDRILRIMISL